MSSWFKPAVVLCIASFAFVPMHGTKAQVSQRLEHIGYRVYQSYYEWTATILDKSIAILDLTMDEVDARRKGQFDRLDEYQEYKIDQELAALYKEYGKWTLRVKDDAVSAQDLLLKSTQFFPKSKVSRTLLTEAYFTQGEYLLAYNSAVRLLDFNNVPKEKSLSMVIHCALEAELYGPALNYAAKLADISAKPVHQEIHLRLKNEDRIEEVKHLFASD